jgi:hypothetical protein
MLDYGIYYEFMPLSELGLDNPKTLTLEQVELQTDYALIITTNGGLWRYELGDTVVFTSLNPFRIKVTGRTKHFINAFGEELMVHNVEHAIDVATAKCNCLVKEYTVAPKFDLSSSIGSHDWVVEFDKEPENLSYFAEVLDNALKSNNSDYEAKRYKNIALTQPNIIKMPTGTFYNWMKQKGKLGGQNKVPRLFNNRKHVDSLLNFVKTKEGINFVN